MVHLLLLLVYMTKLLIFLIYFMISINIYGDNQYFKQPQDPDIDIFYKKLAQSLKSSSNNIESVFQKLTTALGRHQLEELEKRYPGFSNLINFDMTFQFAKSENAEKDDSSKVPQNDNSIEESALIKKDIQKIKSVSYLKIKPDGYFETIDLEYNNEFFLSNIKYSLSKNAFDVQMSKTIFDMNASVQYNTKAATLKTSLMKNLDKNVRVNVSTITYIESKDAFAGISLRYGF